MGLNSLIVPDIALGLNTQVDSYSLRPGEASAINNLTLEHGGQVLAPRNGMAVRQVNPLGSARIHRMYWWELANQLFYSMYGASGRKSGTNPSDAFFGPSGSGIPSSCDFEVAKDSGGLEKLWCMAPGAGVPTKVTPAGVGATWTNAPTNSSLCKLWKGRMVVAGDSAKPDRLYYSDIGNPESPAPYNFIDIRSAYDDSEPITELELIGDNLLVFKENSVWLIYDSNTFANRRLGGPGCWHEGLCAEWNERVYYLGPGGLHSTDGIVAPRLESQKISGLDSLDSETFVSGGSNFTIQQSSLTVDYDQERLFLILTTTLSITGDSLSSTCYEAYFPQSKNNPRKEFVWFLHDWTPDIGHILQAKVATVAFGPLTKVLIGSALNISNSCSMWQLFSGFQDGPSGGRVEIPTLWQSGWMRLTKGVEAKERVRRVNFEITTAGPTDSQNPVVTWKADEGASTIFTGPMKGTEATFRRVRPEVRGRFHLMTVTTTAIANGWTRWEGLEIIFRGGTEH